MKRLFERGAQSRVAGRFARAPLQQIPELVGGRACVARPKRPKLSTAPNTVAPNVLPRLRANRKDAVALPRSDQSTIPWIRMIEALNSRPIPRPTMRDPRPATMGEVSRVRKRKATAPTGTSAPPSRRTARTPKRRKPDADRRTDRPAEHHHRQGEACDQRRFLHHPLHEHRQKGRRARSSPCRSEAKRRSPRRSAGVSKDRAKSSARASGAPA